MKIAQINVSSFGSTGRIMCQIQERALADGNECVSYYGRGNQPDAKGSYVKISNDIAFLFHAFRARFFDKGGHASKITTRRLVKMLKEEKPDIVHLHNIHGYYINLKILFKYLKESNVKVVWTMHDCWPITGGCTYFLVAGCDKWQTGCYKCPQIRFYPQKNVDKSKREYKLKKEIFTSLSDLTIATPSDWLGNYVKNSFMNKYPVRTVYNGIDIKTFQPHSAEDNAEIRRKYGIKDGEKMVLGVANVWDERKRLSVIVSLAGKMQAENVKFVVVGLSEKQQENLPKNIIGITRTENAEELARLYSSADVFVSPSVEESFSLVIAEALSSDTPVVCAEGGGCVELISDEVGFVVPRDDIEKMRNAILKVLENADSYKGKCREHCEKNFSVSNMVQGYMTIYNEIYGK